MSSNSIKPSGIKDVAKKAGVSISTVSNVLTGTRPVSAKLAKKVNDAVKELEYQPNLVGRHLKKGKSGQVAFVTHSITSIFFPNLMKAIQKNADANGYMVSVFGTSGSITKEREIINLLWTQGYDGIFLSSCADTDDPQTVDYIKFLENINSGNPRTHIICLESMISSKLDTITVNDTDGIARVTKYVLEKGRENLAFIAAPIQYETGKNRRMGFISAMKYYDAVVDEDLIVEGNFSCQSGYDAMKKIIKTGKKFDGVVAGNDQMAIGAMKCLKEHKIRIPEEVMVVGFNDNTPASLVSPSLTTMRVPKSEMGSWAFELFLRRAGGDESCRKAMQLEGELVIRNSTDPDIDTEWETDW